MYHFNALLQSFYIEKIQTSSTGIPPPSPFIKKLLDVLIISAVAVLFFGVCLELTNVVTVNALLKNVGGVNLNLYKSAQEKPVKLSGCSVMT